MKDVESFQLSTIKKEKKEERYLEQLLCGWKTSEEITFVAIYILLDDDF